VLYEAVTPEGVAATLGVDQAEVVQSVRAARSGLRELRSRRVRPALDDKAVCAWNGLALRALAEGAVALGEPAYLAAARRTAAFLLDEMRSPNGRLVRSRRGASIGGPGFADDHGAVTLGLLALYQATGEQEWFVEARQVADHLVDGFWDEEHGGVFATAHDAETLIARPKNVYDNPTPSDNSLAAEALQTLAAFTGDPEASRRLEDIFRLGGRLLADYPSAVGHLLGVAAVALAPPRELAIVGSPNHPTTEALLGVARETYRPDVFIARSTGSRAEGTEVPLLAGRTPGPAGGALAYLCRGFVCDAPTQDPETLRALLAGR
jgi:uncharacterized protein YyaL (SSP411 family)